MGKIQGTQAMSMSDHQRNSNEWLCSKGVELLRDGDKLRALKMFERSYEIKQTPECRSYLGMLTATERGQVRKGIELCQAAIDADPQNPVHYLNLSKLLYCVERKTEAVDVVFQARGLAPSEEVESWVRTIGIRKRPVFPFLSRRNPLNKYTGLMLRRFGLR